MSDFGVICPSQTSQSFNKTLAPFCGTTSKIHTPEPSNGSIQISQHYSASEPEIEASKVISTSSVCNYVIRCKLCIFAWDIKYKCISYHGMNLPEL
jgi:hypothetical protein